MKSQAQEVADLKIQLAAAEARLHGYSARVREEAEEQRALTASIVDVAVTVAARLSKA